MEAVDGTVRSYKGFDGTVYIPPILIELSLTDCPCKALLRLC